MDLSLTAFEINFCLYPPARNQPIALLFYSRISVNILHLKKMTSQEKHISFEYPQTRPRPLSSPLQLQVPSPTWSSSSTLDLAPSTPNTPHHHRHSPKILSSTFTSTEKLASSAREKQSPSPDPNSVETPAPEGGLRAWLTVIGSFCITTAVYGLSNSVGVIQPFWAQHQLANFSVHDIGWISGANNFLCLFLGVQFGPWFDRFGPRRLLAGGSLVYLAGLAGLGFLPEDASSGSGITSPGGLFALLMLLWGVVMGTGAALCCAVAVSEIGRAHV